MRKMRKKIAFSAASIISLALSITAMQNISGFKVKAQSNKPDQSIGTIGYYKVNFFDYESSQRSENTHNWLVDGKEVKSDKKLILFNQENYYVTEGPKPSEHNSWIGSTKEKIVEGIVSDKLKNGTVKLSEGREAVSGKNTVNLFDVNDKTFVGSYNFPFEKISNGYWEYDSSKNHVQLSDEVGENGLKNVAREDKVSKIGLMPFNSLNLNSKIVDENGKELYDLAGTKNFYFGMSMELPFNMPKDGKVKTFSGDEEDMIFKFSGDDDIWVFVDGKLVLDLGGIHDPVYGEINFAKGEVTTTGIHYNKETKSYSGESVKKVTKESSVLKSLSEGEHNIQVFFLERGGEKSNCKITFRLADYDETPEITEAPETSAPVVTEAPKTSAPVVTEAPKTSAPVVTEAPKTNAPATNAPETSAPVITETPKTSAPATEAPKTSAPVVTEAPKTSAPVTKDPEVTATPEATTPALNPTEVPEVTKTPETTKAPEVTKDPEVTKAPESIKPTEKVTNDSDDKDNEKTENSEPTKNPKGAVAKGNDNISGGGSNELAEEEGSVARTKLPQTGTADERLFYVIGGVLVVAGLCLVLIPRRKVRK